MSYFCNKPNEGANNMKKILLKTLKYICCGALAFSLALSASLSSFQAVEVFANNTQNATALDYDQLAARLAGQINRVSPPRRVGAMDLRINGEIPRAVITGQPGAMAVNTALNARFIAQYDEFLQAHRGRSFSLNFSTYVYTSGPFVSIVINMKAESLNVTHAAATTVIDARTLEVVSLNHINPNLFSLVNISLLESVDQSPRTFIAGFSGISAGHPFFLNNGVLTFPFASGTLRPTGRDIQYMHFNLNDFQNEALADRYFFILPEQDYRTVMVNISRGAPLFGYEYRWHGLSSTFTIYLNDEVVASATVGQNAYYYAGGGSSRMLEVAPSLRRNNVYVPLSFFSEILGIAATVIYEDSIVLTKHLR